MADRLAAVALRVLAPRAHALGPGDGDSIQNVNTTELPNGCLAYAQDVETFYVLRKRTVVVPGPVPGGVINPASGPGQWVALLGFEANFQLSYQIAMDETVDVVLTTGGNWTAFPNTTHWSEADGVLAGTGLINGTAFWTSATPGAGILTYHGPTRFFDVHADVSVSHASGADQPVFGLVVSKNGNFLGSNALLLREQQTSQEAGSAGTPAHIHTASRIVMQDGDTLQIAIVDHGPAQNTTVARASLMVSPS